MLSRRQLLAASPTALPLFLGLSACRGPAVLSAPPAASPQTQALQHAVTAELNLICIYNKTMGAYSALATTLAPLRAEHQAHLAQLRSRVIEPPGQHGPDAVTEKPALGRTEAAALTQLSAAEQAAVTTLMGRLAGSPAALAQLYASIAASEMTHARVLSDKAGS